MPTAGANLGWLVAGGRGVGSPTPPTGNELQGLPLNAAAHSSPGATHLPTDPGHVLRTLHANSLCTGCAWRCVCNTPCRTDTVHTGPVPQPRPRLSHRPHLPSLQTHRHPQPHRPAHAQGRGAAGAACGLAGLVLILPLTSRDRVSPGRARLESGMVCGAGLSLPAPPPAGTSGLVNCSAQEPVSHMGEERAGGQGICATRVCGRQWPSPLGASSGHLADYTTGWGRCGREAVSPANLSRTGLSYSHQRFSDQAEAEEQAVQVCRGEFTNSGWAHPPEGASGGQRLGLSGANTRLGGFCLFDHFNTGNAGPVTGHP